MKKVGNFVLKNALLCVAIGLFLASAYGYLFVPSIGPILAIIGGLFVGVHFFNRYFMAR